MARISAEVSLALEARAETLGGYTTGLGARPGDTLGGAETRARGGTRGKGQLGGGARHQGKGTEPGVGVGTELGVSKNARGRHRG